MQPMRAVHLRSVDLNLLVVLQALMEERHITRAAQRLNMSQPAVSRALQRLRHLFQDPLLIRAGSQMLPTRRGEELGGRVGSLLGEVSTMLVAGEFEPARAVDRVRVCATEGVVTSVLAEAMADIVAQAPRLEIHVSSEMADAYELLETGKADLAIDVFPDLAGAAFHRTPLFSNPLVCVARAAREGPRRMTRDAYVRARHVQVVGGTNRWIAMQLAELGLERDVAISVPGYLGAAALVAKTDLVLTLPALLAEIAARRFGVAVHPLPFDVPEVTLLALWHARRHTDPAHRWVRSRIIATALRVGAQFGRKRSSRPQKKVARS